MWMLAQDAPPPPAGAWTEAVRNLTSTGSITMILIFGIPIIAIVMGCLTSILTGRARERTRQEIAAYVAEGSISAEEGARLLAAGSKSGSKDGR